MKIENNLGSNSAPLSLGLCWKTNIAFLVLLTGWAVLPYSQAQAEALAPLALPSTPPFAPTAPNEPSKSGGLDVSKVAEGMEDKVSENAKSVVNRLGNSSTAMTLEELNSAKQTVARIDAMIDIEKRMIELNKLRGEHSGRSNSNSIPTLAAAIPASALAPLPHFTSVIEPSAPSRPAVKEQPKASAEGIEISRVTGADGNYSALLKLTDGTLKSVKVGDQILDHTTVQRIYPSSVVIIDANGKTSVLRIKNVGTIYSARQ